MNCYSEIEEREPMHFGYLLGERVSENNRKAKLRLK